MFVSALCNPRPQKQVLPCFAFLTRFNLSGAYDVGAPNAQLCQQHMSFRVSPCLEASSAKYEVEEVEEATTQALSGSLCFCWRGLRISAWLLQAKAGFDQAGSVKARRLWSIA